MHRNAPLTPEGRLRLCCLIEDGWTVAAAAESMRISPPDGAQVVAPLPEARRPASSTAQPTPALSDQDPGQVGRRVVELRRRHQNGLARLSERAGIPTSTLHRIWVRHGVSRLSDLERRTGRVIRGSRPADPVNSSTST